MKPFPNKGRIFYQAPREVEALADLSSDAKRLWSYGRFREYPGKPAALREADFERDLAMGRRTIQRAKRKLLEHDPPLLVVHRRGTRNAPASLLHFLLPGESTPRCCALKKPQSDKTRPTKHRVGGLTCTVQAGCDGATSETAGTYAPHRTKDKRTKEKNASRAAASPGGPPPAGDGDGNGDGRSLAELRAMLAGLVKPWLRDGGATGRRIAAEIGALVAAGQDAAEPLPAKRPATAPACLADDPGACQLAAAFLEA